MAKFQGKIGYRHTEETPADSGVWKAIITEKDVHGDVLRNARNLQEGEKINDDLSIDNSLSIVADAYASEHFFAIRYVKWAGAYWTVTNVAVERPRLLLRLGGVYNGPRAPVEETP